MPAICIVENDEIVNRVVAQDPDTYTDPQGREVVDGSYQIGWVRQDDGTFAPPIPPVSERKVDLRSRARQQFEASLRRGFSFDGGQWAPVGERRQRVLELVAGINAGKGLPQGKSTIRLFDASKSPHDFDAQQIVGLSKAASDLIEAAEDRLSEIIGQIDAATTQADLDAIDVTTGWPN